MKEYEPKLSEADLNNIDGLILSELNQIKRMGMEEHTKIYVESLHELQVKLDNARGK